MLPNKDAFYVALVTKNIAQIVANELSYHFRTEFEVETEPEAALAHIIYRGHISDSQKRNIRLWAKAIIRGIVLAVANKLTTY